MKLNRKTIITIAAALLAAGLVLGMAGCGGSKASAASEDGIPFTVKTKDGGELGLYESTALRPNGQGFYDDASPRKKVPDGTEVGFLYAGKNNVSLSVRYQGTRYYVNPQHLAEFDADSLSKQMKSASNKARGSRDFTLILQVLIPIAIGIFAATLFGKKAKARFAVYYAKKRKQFPWLENWIKEHGDPEPVRMKDRLSMARFVIFGALTIGLVGGGIVVNIFVFDILVAGTATTVITAILLAIALLIANKRVGKPQSEISWMSELTLECPQCGCPHAWSLTAYNIVVSKVDISISTTTTTTESKWKGGSPDIIDWGMSGFKKDGTTTKKKSTKRVAITGTEITDFHCENCNHTPHTEKEIDGSYIAIDRVIRIGGILFQDSAFKEGGAREDDLSNNWDAQDGLAKWAGEFAGRVQANAAAAKIPANAVAALQKRTADYTASYRAGKYLDAEAAGEYYKSYAREFAFHYLKDVPAEKRALFGLKADFTLYAWDKQAKEASGKSA
jgi:hypothetical protein